MAYCHVARVADIHDAHHLAGTKACYSSALRDATTLPNLKALSCLLPSSLSYQRLVNSIVASLGVLQLPTVTRTGAFVAMAEAGASAQEPPVQLVLKSKDGEKFEVDKDVAMQIQFVKGMLEGMFQIFFDHFLRASR